MSTYLLSYDLSQETRQRQHERLTATRAAYETAWKTYESLPRTPEEEQLWQAFTVAWQAWRNDNDEFFRLQAALDKMGLGDPDELEGKLATFRGDHHHVCQNLLTMLLSKQPFAGGENAHVCNFGKWLDSYATENPEIREAIRAVAEPHQRFHAATAKVKTLFANGDMQTAISVYQREMIPAAEAVFGHLDRIHQLCEKAQNLANNRDHQALEVCRLSQQRMNDLLDKVVKINIDGGEQAVKQAEHASTLATLFSASATTLGIVAALALGIVLTLTITKPVLKGVKFAEALAGGDLTRTLEIDQADEIGHLAKALNHMGAKLREMFTNLTQNATILNSSSSDLSATAAQLASGAEETTNQSATVAAAAEQMTSNMTNMAAASEQMSANVRVVACSLTVDASIREVARSAEQAAQVSTTAELAEWH